MFLFRSYAHQLSIVRFTMLLCIIYLLSPFYADKMHIQSTKALNLVKSISIANYIDLSQAPTPPFHKDRHLKTKKYMSKYEAIKIQKMLSKYAIKAQVKVSNRGYQVIAPYHINIMQSKPLRYELGGKL